MCGVCRGGAGRHRKKEQNREVVLRRPAAAPVQREEPALERIASALERLAATAEAQAAAPTCPSPSAPPSQEAQVRMPAVLQPLYEAGLAAVGQQGGAKAVVAAFQVGPHRNAGLLFGMLNGILAVASPQVRLAGLSAAPPKCGDLARFARFCQEHQALTLQAVWGGVTLATVVQSVARSFRRDPVSRRRHAQRFLDELASLMRL